MVGLPVDFSAARKIFEKFVAVRDAGGSQSRLDRLAENFPCLIEIGANARGVSINFAESALQRFPSDQNMPERNVGFAGLWNR